MRYLLLALVTAIVLHMVLSAFLPYYRTLQLLAVLWLVS
jgi:uncharacterized membrane protein